jgi:hypothetical protein
MVTYDIRIWQYDTSSGIISMQKYISLHEQAVLWTMGIRKQWSKFHLRLKRS